MRVPSIIDADQMNRDTLAGVSTPDGVKWVVARPEPFYSMFARWKCAWLVFTGRCDALRWYGQ